MIQAHIPTGRQHAIKKDEIARRVGMPVRLVEREIESLRKSGKVAICSDSQVGYWLPMNAAEYARNIELRRRRAIHQLLTNRGERRCLRVMETREAMPLAFAWDSAA